MKLYQIKREKFQNYFIMSLDRQLKSITYLKKVKFNFNNLLSYFNIIKIIHNNSDIEIKMKINFIDFLLFHLLIKMTHNT